MYNALSALDKDSDWIFLTPGDNLITVRADTGIDNVSAIISFETSTKVSDMEFRVLDENFNQVHVLDNFKSAIWTDSILRGREISQSSFLLRGVPLRDPYRSIRVELHVKSDHDDREDRHQLRRR